MIPNEELAALADAVSALRDRVVRLERLGGVAAGEPGRAAPELLRLADTDGASARVWSSLVRWVRAVAVAYQLDNHDLPQCWHEHGAYVRELAGLQRAHEGALQEGGRDARAMVTWHTDLQVTLARLRNSHIGQRCATQHDDANVTRSERTGRIVNRHASPDRWATPRGSLRT